MHDLFSLRPFLARPIEMVQQWEIFNSAVQPERFGPQALQMIKGPGFLLKNMDNHVISIN